MIRSLKSRNTWDLVWQLFRTDFKLKYNDSILGFLWVLIKPFTLFLIMYFVLTRVFPNPVANYPLYLLMGNIFITFWNEGTTLGMDSLLSRASLITKVNFPRYIVLVSSTFIAVVNFLINMVIFTIIMFINGIYPSLMQLGWVLFCSIILYVLILSVSMFTSITYVKFRDLKQIWELFNQLVFWATPVIYTIDKMGDKSEVLNFILTKLNPISVLLSSARKGVLEYDISYIPNVFVWMGITIVIASCGYVYFKRSIKQIAEFF